MIEKDKLLVTAGGRITCQRCQAASKRSKLQCKNPALRGKQVCGFHGGLSTGPRTEEGRERVRQAHIKSGGYTQEARLRQSRASLRLAQLEDMMHVLNMTSATRTRGAKPAGYKRLTTLDDVRDAVATLDTPA
jgi:hypothetical protein